MKADRLTPHRAAVLDALRASHDHPTAAEVFRRVRRKRPGVACATIYNALNWLTRNGLVAELKLGDEASRFDPIIERHDHLVCTRCGKLVDSFIELPRTCWVEAGRRSGFRVEKYRLELFGVCPRCARNSRRRSSQTAAPVHASA
jgi:Fur family ferric uptake transcriptional regulator/Fur family peroxide stress response transcriptional regulator